MVGVLGSDLKLPNYISPRQMSAEKPSRISNVDELMPRVAAEHASILSTVDSQESFISVDDLCLAISFKIKNR